MLTVALEALERIAPQWCRDEDAVVERLAKAEAEVKRLGAMLGMVVQRLAAMAEDQR